MFISHRFPTQFGRGLSCPPIGLTIPADPTEALAFAVKADRAADAFLAEGRFEQAEKLAHAALEARCRAQGCRA